MQLGWFTAETLSTHGSTVREASRQASSTAFSSEPVEESPRAEFFIAAHPELGRRTRPQALRGEISFCVFTEASLLDALRENRRWRGGSGTACCCRRGCRLRATATP